MSSQQLNFSTSQPFSRRPACPLAKAFGVSCIAWLGLCRGSSRDADRRKNDTDKRDRGSGRIPEHISLVKQRDAGETGPLQKKMRKPRETKLPMLLGARERTR